MIAVKPPSPEAPVISSHSPKLPPPIPPIDEARVREISGLMENHPVFFTPRFSDRVFWNARAREKSVDVLAAEANRLAALPVPELTATLFARYFATGERAPYEQTFSERSHRLNVFLFAEGLSANTRYLPVIERELAAILDEPTWASPAHVQGQSDWTRCRQVIDLAAAARAWSLATTDFLLGDRLAPATRARIRAEIRDRVLGPYAARALRGGQAEHLFRWMTGVSNWNAVCNAGVCGAALLLCETKAERAWFAAAFEAFTRRFIDGYADDGYCHEGIGYWVYGFGHYAMAAEAVRLSTAGVVDLASRSDKIRRIGRFGANWSIDGKLYPAFGDAHMDNPPPAWLNDFCARRYGVSASSPAARAPDGLSYFRHGLGAHLFVTAFDLASPSPASGAAAASHMPPRSWYPEGGALVARRANPTRGLAVALKGGDNGQPHCHHDLGSFVVLCDGEPLLLDPGRDTYVRDTFSEKRFTSGIMNSFGHPVPRVAGRFQRGGSEARAVTIRADFTDENDTWEIDLTSAYDVPELERLRRTFTFSRSDGGRLEIRDHVVFHRPQTFGSALILDPALHHEAMEAGCRVRGGTAAVTVRWRAKTDGTAGAVHVNEEPVFGIVPSEGPKALRIGLELAAPVREATLTVVVTRSAELSPHP